MKRLRRQRLSVKAHTTVSESRRLRAMRLMRTAASIAAAGVAGLLMLSLALVKAEARTQASKSAEAPKGNAENGKKIFVKYGCYECHGRQAQGSLLLGPRLGPDPIPLAAMIAYVRKPSGEMPPYTEKVVSDQELADIHAFLQSLPQPPPVKTMPILK
jgi:mono/diheme cytochrome c family protein